MLSFFKRVRGAQEEIAVPEDMHEFQTGRALLEPHTKLINHIKRLSSASSDGFNTYYLPTIERYVEAMQLLPVATEGPFSKLGGMVEKSLLLIIESLRVRQGYLLPIGSTAEEISKTKELWTYAVFIGALVHRCGQGIYEFEMVFFDKRGKPLGDRYWPGISKLDPEFSYYKIKRLDNTTKKLERQFPLILLSSWLGEGGINWMLSNNIALESLLSSMVGGDLDDKNALSEIIKKAYAHLTKGEQNVYSLDGLSTKDDAKQPVPEILKESVSKQPIIESEAMATVIEEELPMTDESGAILGNQEPGKEGGNVDWLDAAPEKFMVKLLSDLKGGGLPKSDFDSSDGVINIRYPQGLKRYTVSPSDMRMKLKQSVIWGSEGKISLNNEKAVKVITLIN